MGTRWSLVFALLGPAMALANSGYDTPMRLVVQRGAGDPGLVRDCYIWEDEPPHNGDSETLYTGLVGTGEKMTFLWFDVSAVPSGAKVLGAQLLLYAIEADGGRVTAHHASMAWQEDEPTWSAFSTAYETAPVSTSTPVATGPMLLDVTDAVRDWVSGARPNDGLVLRQSLTRPSSSFASSEVSAPSQRPMLEVWYELPSPLVRSTPTETLEAACGMKLRYGLAAHAPRATSWSVSGAPDGLTVDAASGELTWTPTDEQVGGHQLSVQVTDTDGSAEDLTVDIGVTCMASLEVGCGAAPAGPFSALLLALFAVRRRRRA